MKIDTRLMVRTRPSAVQSIVMAHEQLRKQLGKLPNLGLNSKDIGDVHEPGDQPSSSVSIKSCLNSGMSGSIDYLNRAYLPDEAMYDDFFCVDLKRDRVAYAELVKFDFRKLISVMQAYYAAVIELTIFDADFEKWQKWGRKHDDRHQVFRIWPVSFYDSKLCKSAFGRSPREVARRLKGQVEDVLLESGGVLIVASYQRMSESEAKSFDHKVRALLT